MSETRPPPPPLYYEGPPVQCAPLDVMPPAEKVTYRVAALTATQLYPGAVGQLLSRALLDPLDFGWRVAPTSLVRRVRDEVMREAHRRERERAGA